MGVGLGEGGAITAALGRRTRRGQLRWQGAVGAGPSLGRPALPTGPSRTGGAKKQRLQDRRQAGRGDDRMRTGGGEYVGLQLPRVHHSRLSHASMPLPIGKPRKR